MDQMTGNTVVCTAPPFGHVLVSGELDLASSPMLAACLRDAAVAGCRAFRVDLSGVTFCDVSAVRVLVQVDRSMRRAGGSLHIVAASACVRRVLELLGLCSLLENAEHTVIAPRPA